MKQSRLITTILLVGLILVGWTSAFLATDSGSMEEYKVHIQTAEDYVDRGLYQKAIEEYDSALSIKKTEDVWAAKLVAYEKHYAESKENYSDYVSAAQLAVSSYSKNVDFLMTLVNLYISHDEYSSAYKALQDAVDRGIKDNEVDSILLKVKYAYEIKWKAYTGYRPCMNGLYAVDETGMWTYTKEDGTETDFGQLLFAGSVGESGIRVIQDKDRGQLIDSNRVLQGILNFEPKDAGIYSEGLVAISDGTSYSYYNSLGDKQFGEYAQAGAFVDGQAAVQQGDEWFVINTKGEKVSDEVYEEIVLQANGTHLMNGVMIAKKDGVYKFYKDGKSLGGYSNVDIITDDNRVAVCQNGKWGYVDLEGNELIAFTYADAKSFSNGLAAVSNGEYWGFIDINGTLVIDYIFFGADYFNSDFCCMVETGKGTTWQLISLYNKQ